MAEEKFIEEDGMIIIENPGEIYHLISLKHAIRIEKLGLRRSHGPTAMTIARKTYGFKGNGDKLIKQINDRLRELRPDVDPER